jgi:hypothetical protein
LLQQPGELRVSAAVSNGSDVNNAIEFQGAYAATNKVGVIVNTLFARADDNSGSHGYFIEGGAGYFRPVRRRLVFETYAGAGVGSVSGAYNSTFSSANYADVNFGRFFVQPDFGFRSNYFEAVVSNRFSVLHYGAITGTSTNSDVDYIRTHPTSTLVEPAFILRAGLKYAKAELQLSNSYNLSAPHLPQENTMVSFGVSFQPIRRKDTH